jgi:hypothetical protein
MQNKGFNQELQNYGFNQELQNYGIQNPFKLSIFLIFNQKIPFPMIALCKKQVIFLSLKGLIETKKARCAGFFDGLSKLP